VKVLVANLGSTSFKYRLFDLGDPAEPVLARGSIERIGSASARVVIKSTRGERELVCPIADHGEAVQLCLAQLTDPETGVVRDAGEISAIGFKAVHARNLTGVHLVDRLEADRRDFACVPQSTVHPGDADAARPVPRSSARRCVRDRLSPDDSRGKSTIRHTRPVGDRARHPAVGISWRQPPIHRGPDARAAGSERHQADLLPPGG